ncbi:hypothetical protein LCGC14_0434160 [marine sediment metagenome]|uniref:DNA (cytosine-5-)-methyltransferase n=1 Tax=marine sediment metagenome TaxID=412755 RepID=A0A0F9V943_9ZZZZ
MSKEFDKVILDLCAGTGAWSKPYADAGYDVRLITLPEWDVNNYDTRLLLAATKPYGILAAPPCTMFSLARQNAKTPRDLRSAMYVVRSCMEIIWECRCEHQLIFWALENPTGYLRQFLGKPAFTFKPCDFGDPMAKRTDLWGYYNFPKKQKSPAVVPIGHHRNSANYPRNPVKRAITPPGFAKAFFEANR